MGITNRMYSGKTFEQELANLKQENMNKMDIQEKYQARIQFKGSLVLFRTELIWKAQVENKCKIFARILVQDKILTAHNLQKRGWPHQEHCVLRNGPLETSLHLCLCCPFAKAVWDQILSWENFTELQSHLQAAPVHIMTLWEEAVNRVPNSERRRLNGVIIYTFWNIFKEKQENYQQRN